MNELRLYTFGNMYMSSIQQGIQAAHSQMEMFLKYDYEPGQGAQLYDWACNHKTIICLNAGMDINLKNILSLLGNEENKFAWSYFRESKDAMDSMLTNVAVILPERIFGRRNRVINGETMLWNGIEYLPTDIILTNGCPSSAIAYEFNDFENELWNILNSCGLAK